MITVVGESLVDLVRPSVGPRPPGVAPAEYPGGSPANVAVGLGRLGVPVTLVTQLGDDGYGRLLRDHLTGSAVRLAEVPGRAATSTATAVIDERGGARYEFDISWDVRAPLAVAPATRCLHTGSLATALDPGARVVEELLVRQRRDAAVTVSLDPNVRPALLPSRAAARDRVERQVELADVVKVSEEDLAWLYPRARPAEVALRWRQAGPALVVVTLGADGALAVADGGMVRRPAPAVGVADTVGAGDAFTAGMLYWLHRAGLLGGGGHRERLRGLRQRDIARLLDAAAAVAAATCARPGADPPTLAELRGARGWEPPVADAAGRGGS